MEYKYTTDGKKVVVIGDLNSQEKIVQEIFIVNGKEIPSGENFVAKSLHDQPAVSWKETQLKELESRYEKDRKEWDLKIDNLNKEKRVVYDSLNARVRWLRKISKEPREAEFKKVINQIADFLTDSEKWVLVRNYSKWNLFKFNEDGANSFLDNYDRSYGRLNFDSMRLLSLFGKTDGSLIFRINDYSDGSGSDENVLFFKSEKEALDFIQNDFDNVKEYNSFHLESAKKFNLKIDAEKMEVYVNQAVKNFDKNIKEYQKSIDHQIERKHDLLSELKKANKNT